MKKKTEILVDGVALSNTQTEAVRGLATIGYYTVAFGTAWAIGKAATKIHDWNELRKYKKFLKNGEKKEKEEAE